MSERALLNWPDAQIDTYSSTYSFIYDIWAMTPKYTYVYVLWTSTSSTYYSSLFKSKLGKIRFFFFFFFLDCQLLLIK